MTRRAWFAAAIVAVSLLGLVASIDMNVYRLAFFVSSGVYGAVSFFRNFDAAPLPAQRMGEWHASREVWMRAYDLDDAP